MKILRILSLCLILMAGLSGFAQVANHAQHAKHNMVLFGESEIFASHIVYKQPHNFQVILKLALDPANRALYLAEKAKFPKDQFLYLLDPMDIKDIESVSGIAGTILRIDAAGVRKEIAHDVQVPCGKFEVIYFDEVPLSLNGT